MADQRNPHLFENLMANLEPQAAHYEQKGLEVESFEERSHWGCKAEGIRYAIRLLHVFRPEFPDQEGVENCACLACQEGASQ